MGAGAGVAAVSPPRVCPFSNYVSVADDSDSDAEDNTLDVAFNLDSRATVWLYPFTSVNNGKIWVAYLHKCDRIAWVKAESPRCLSANDLRVGTLIIHFWCRCNCDVIDSIFHRTVKFGQPNCLVFTAPEHEVRRARAERREQRQAKKREEQIRKAQEEQEEQSRLNTGIRQAAANFPTSLRQFMSQPSVVERHEACLQQVSKGRKEQANDAVSETIVTSGAAPEGADSQAHRSAEKNQDASTSY